MTHDKAQEVLDARLAEGFDASEVRADYAVRVRCSQCAATCINGVACHETGCPNETRECSECDARVPKRQRLCEDCARADDWDGYTEDMG